LQRLSGQSGWVDNRMCSIEQGFNLTTHKVAILPPHKLQKAKKKLKMIPRNLCSGMSAG
jgi:hypothetical protein